MDLEVSSRESGGGSTGIIKLSPSCKWLLILTMCQIALEVIKRVSAFFFLTDQRMEQVWFIVTASISMVFLLYFCLMSILGENQFHLLAVLFTSAYYSVHGVFEYLHWNETSKYRIELHIMHIFSWILQVCFLFCCFAVRKSFGWRFFRAAGDYVGDATLSKLFQNYQVFLTTKAVDLELSFMIIFSGGMYMSSDAAWIAGAAIVFCFEVCWFFMGTTAVENEEGGQMRCFFLLSFAMPVYLLTYTLIGWIDRGVHNQLDKTTWIQAKLAVLIAAAVLVRTLTLLVGWKAYKGFRKGLKQKVFNQLGKKRAVSAFK